MLKTQPIRITHDEIMKLTKIATAFRCHAPSGPTFGRPSWRTLIKDIARHRIDIVSNDGSDYQAYLDSIAADALSDADDIAEMNPVQQIVLQLEDFAELLAIAEKVGAIARTSSSAGNPSWRTLIRSLARGEMFAVQEPSWRQFLASE